MLGGGVAPASLRFSAGALFSLTGLLTQTGERGSPVSVLTVDAVQSCHRECLKLARRGGGRI